jgi:hypothetical protein
MDVWCFPCRDLGFGISDVTDETNDGVGRIAGDVLEEGELRMNVKQSVLKCAVSCPTYSKSSIGARDNV